MNEQHALCGSDEWRALVRENLLPWALGDLSLGDDVIEVGPGYGAVTDVLGESVARLTAVEIDEGLAATLTRRFRDNTAVHVVRGDATSLEFPDARFTGAACFTMLHHVPTVELQDRVFGEVARVLRRGGSLVAADSLASPDLEALHHGDTYNPIDPSGLERRLRAAGFASVELRTNALGWVAQARRS